jgi:hypothetical protein
VGGRHLLGEVQLKLWIESAYAGLVAPDGGTRGDVGRTLQTGEQFFAILASNPRGDMKGRARAESVVDTAASMLLQPVSPDAVAESVLDVLPSGEHAPFAILQVVGGNQAYVVECDAPPLFLVRGGELVLLPVLEAISHGRLIRTCRFPLQDGDHLAMVSEGYIRARGWSRRWGWREIAVSTRRWTDTGCDAEQLLGALIRTVHRLAGEETPCADAHADAHTCAPGAGDISVVAMHVRPTHTATIWTGPPADPAKDEVALHRLMAEPGTRIICGDTTAQIAARLLGSELELESRPEDGADRTHPWAEVPPVSRMAGVDLVTEGWVTLGKARERVAGAQHVRDLPREEDGATRLARALLKADRIHFIVGRAVNPGFGTEVDAEGVRPVPLRQVAVEELMRDLKAQGRLVSVEYL